MFNTAVWTLTARVVFDIVSDKVDQRRVVCLVRPLAGRKFCLMRDSHGKVLFSWHVAYKLFEVSDQAIQNFIPNISNYVYNFGKLVDGREIFFWQSHSIFQCGTAIHNRSTGAHNVYLCNWRFNRYWKCTSAPIVSGSVGNALCIKWLQLEHRVYSIHCEVNCVNLMAYLLTDFILGLGFELFFLCLTKPGRSLWIQTSNGKHCWGQ